MRWTALLFVLMTGACGVDTSIDLGAIDQQEPPSKKELVVPKNSAGIAVVGLRAPILGTADKTSSLKVYVLVNPLSNPDTQNIWWVQEEVRRDGESFRCSCQFGEGNQGSGEYFAIVAVMSEKEMTVGEKYDGLPGKLTYSKLKIVKRE